MISLSPAAVNGRVQADARRGRGRAPVAAALRLAVAGLVHDHVWNLLAQFAATGQTRAVAVADAHPPLVERAQREYGFEAVVPAPGDLFAHRPDLVLCCTSNAATAAVVEACADHGVAVLVEKPLAANLAQARRIAAAAARASIPVMCNWPTAWDAGIQYAAGQIADGALGSLYTLRYRAAHAGPREIGCSPFFYSWLYDAEANGAGALMDYCCYGAALAGWLLDLPDLVSGVKGRLVKTDIPVEDNAVLLLQYPGCFALAEASWTQVGHRPYGFQALGPRAGLVADAGRLLLVDEAAPDGVPVDVPALPPGRRNGPEYFVDCLRAGHAPEGLCSLEVACRAQRILEAGLISSRTGAAVAPRLL